MTKLYKLTDGKSQTHGGCQWGEGVEHTASGKGELCSLGWLHAYTHPLLAVILNPIHANFGEPLLWEAEGDVGVTDNELKVGCTRLKTIRQIPLPVVTTAQKIRFAILCAMQVYAEQKWVKWAEGWLSGSNCSADAAADAAAYAAYTAADAAAYAADAAAYAAYTAADVAAYVAYAADAAAYAANCNIDFSLSTIAEEAMQV